MNRLRAMTYTTVLILVPFAALLAINSRGAPSWNGVKYYLPYFLTFVVAGWLIPHPREYDAPHRGNAGSRWVAKVGIAGVLVCTLASFFAGRSPEYLFTMALALAVGLFYSLAAMVAQFAWRGEHARRRALLVGANDRAQPLIKALRDEGWLIAGVLDDDSNRGAGFERDGVAWFGKIADFGHVVREKHIDAVYLALPLASYYNVVCDVARAGAERGIPVYVYADFFPLRVARSRPGYVADLPLLALSATPQNQVALMVKRLVDLAVSSVLLMLLAPAFLAMAIIIKADSKGPVFFYQERVGRHGRRFKMIKFRSMVADAEARRAAIESLNEADGPVFKIRKDPRITRVGAFIRKYSIDEFPQLINVWKGEMSLVGPRPPVPSEVAEYAWAQRRRLSIKPGMTGLWQVSGRSDIGFEEWVRLDLTYIDSWSLWLDFLILLKTFRAVVQGRGAA